MNPRSLLLALLLTCPLVAGANQAERKQSELDALKLRLQTLQQEFRQTQVQRRDAADELRESELAVSNGLRALRQIDGERRQTEITLDALSRQIDEVSVRIRTQQAHLAQALRGVYRRGEGDALKLLLNGADPNQSARDLRYLAYLSRAQQAQVAALRADQAQLAALQQAARDKTDQLAALRSVRVSEQEKLLADKRAREQVLQKLATQIQQQRREISTLQRDERNLTRLVERLNRLMAEQAARAAREAKRKQQAVTPSGKTSAGKGIGTNTETPTAFKTDKPFSRLRGLLRLPVAGELMNRFGAPREGGGTSWKGLFIRASQGVAVKAIAAGQVVFSDWLRGFGNLIIVDHGEGYMSLYSNNESLYKQVGDRVEPGDALASVGNSGGQPDTGLYFEMRHQSRPINPMQWVK
ncbi:peptidoglycan DD-metalloendopeptidase family protein [Betaproteobacteria bacterium SCN1]|nr:peptidoglycan DD-metalloendopeptidase family protein [Betaproteobacteria bacterium SCN1]MBN8759139.1 peptidoglycan DD-metalloendopeptidase family protein [Thiobacillus sp.]ODU91214.1 MAG: peptidase M23 [Thiobacillus sp. SCN 65-179]OJW38116.1 MAG: peptidase M23 [Thiobacillus sp. 65-69]